MKPYYQHGGITIYHGDCRQVLPSVSADLVVTSPPYNRGSRIDGNWQGVVTESCKSNRFRGGYGEYSDDMDWNDYRAWLRSIMADVWKSVAEGGAMWFNHKPRIVNGRLWMPTEAIGEMPLRQIVIWETGPGVNFNPGAMLPSHEWIMLVAHESWRLVGRRASVEGDVWGLGRSQSMLHPASFPLSLPTKCIAVSPCHLILDPFMGIGTTLRAAKDLGRQAIGIEIEERYCEIAAKRMEQEVFAWKETAVPGTSPLDP